MNFQGFSPDSFEQFIRALSLKVLGPGVTLFGNGPDGGREAVFQGTVNFPFPPIDVWDGYGVIQAKFKEKVEGTKKDQTWAAKQLNDELDLWKTSSKRNPKPDYFIYCTNVELSSAANGGRSTCEKLLQAYKETSQLKGFAIWDANQLSGYINGYEEIRKRFRCFLTTGDLISEFSKLLNRVPDPEAILGSYLCREIVADEDARLSQAGDRSEDRIRLANVFLDLPVGLSPSSEPPHETASKHLPPGSLHELLRAGSHKLDSLTLYEQRELSKRGDLESERVYGRYVLIGGPGSGKSTVGQFLAQIHRAALLSRREPHRLEDKVRTIVNDIKARCGEEGAYWPSTPRYPFRIELNAFAKALAAGNPKNGVVSLSEYLRKQLTRDFELTHEDLRDWLKAFPWLLIFDGLDEVPSSSNRREVITAIQNFLNEARDVEADLMIVSSSRPDGYAGEFDGDEVAQRYLLPLSKPRALACAQRLVTAKTAIKGDQRAAEAMAILTSAIDNPLIARLMRSPLQVTFMVTVVAASGKPSESRWQLFNDYYRTIYERELHKAVPPFDQVLNERRQDIDALHHRVGFILQYRAESSGGTQAELSIEEFKQLVTACLEENGLLAEDLIKQTDMILGAASLRLVFLTSRTPGRLSFDIRSLQEYMAAACLTNADSSEVIHRLDFVAHSAYWRNTLLFAVGRFFVEPQMRAHRDKIRVLCEDLNLKDPSRAATRLGSRLALEILESGTIGNVPLFNRSLAACALQLLANPPTDEDAVLARLGHIYDETMDKEFENAITLWLGQKEWPRTLAAWILVLTLERKGVQWAARLAADNWPNSIEIAWQIMKIWFANFTSMYGERTLSEIDLERLQKVVPQLTPYEFSEESILELTSVQTNPAWLSPVSRFLMANRGRQFHARLVFHDFDPGISVGFNSLFFRNRQFENINKLILEPDAHPSWKAIVSLANWFQTLSVDNLHSAVEHLGYSYEPKQWDFWFDVTPWPLVCWLANISELRTRPSNTELQELINLWSDRENQWKEKGISLTDLLSPPDNTGLPPVVAVTTANLGSCEENTARKTVDALLENLKGIWPLQVKNALAWMVTFYDEEASVFDPDTLKTVVLPARKRWWSWDFVFKSADLKDNAERWAHFYDCFGRMKELEFSLNASDAHLEFLLTEFVRDPSRLGLLRLAGFLCAAGGKPEFVTLNIQPQHFKDPRFRLAALLVLISRSDFGFSQADEIVKHLPLVVVENGEPKALDILLASIERHGSAIPAWELVIAKLIDLIPVERSDLLARAEVLRDNILQARPSGFDPELLTKLQLPFIETPNY